MPLQSPVHAPVANNTSPRPVGRPRGSQNLSKAVKHKKRKRQVVIAVLGAGWREIPLVYDPKLRDSKGHLKAGVIKELDKRASKV